MRQKINLLGIGIVTAAITYESTVRITATPEEELFLSMLMLHGIAYFGLATSLLLYFHDTTRGHLKAILVASAVGLCIELIQMQLQYRFFSTKDIVANTAGASLILLDHRSIITSRVVELEDRILDIAAEPSKYF